MNEQIQWFHFGDGLCNCLPFHHNCADLNPLNSVWIGCFLTPLARLYSCRHVAMVTPTLLLFVLRGYSLLVMRIPTLTSLGLRSLRKINDGGVYITGNSQLCYHDTVNWTRLFSSSSRPQRRHKTIDIKENQPQDRCGNEGGGQCVCVCVRVCVSCIKRTKCVMQYVFLFLLIH